MMGPLCAVIPQYCSLNTVVISSNGDLVLALTLLEMCLVISVTLPRGPFPHLVGLRFSI